MTMCIHQFVQRPRVIGGLRAFSFALVVFGAIAHAQDATPVTPAVPATDTADDSWQRYDWLKASEDQKRQAASGETVTTHVTQDVGNPFTTVNTGALWKDKYDALYTRRVADTLSLSYETSSTMFNGTELDTVPLVGGSPYDLSHGQKVGMQFQPGSALTLQANLHDSMTDASLPGDSIITTGAGFYAEGHLPTNSVVSLGVNADTTGTDTVSSTQTATTSYDAQLTQPVNNLPLSAILKGHFEETSVAGAAPTQIPSLEQSLVWKPVENTAVQMGLRQQTYQEYPGIDDKLNEALFADLSMKVVDDVTWHSYAEMLNSRSLVDQAPGSPLASGANGTAQATLPGSNMGLSSALPLSFTNQTLTFSTGPSFKLQKDISASVEYSNRWDQTAAPGSVGQEQRVSVSIKGSF